MNFTKIWWGGGYGCIQLVQGRVVRESLMQTEMNLAATIKVRNFLTNSQTPGFRQKCPDLGVKVEYYTSLKCL